MFFVCCPWQDHLGICSPGTGESEESVLREFNLRVPLRRKPAKSGLTTFQFFAVHQKKVQQLLYRPFSSFPVMLK